MKKSKKYHPRALFQAANRRLHPNKILLPQCKNQDQVQWESKFISFHRYLRFSMLDAKQFVLRQAVEQPTKPTEITSSDLLPSKAARSGVWQWFRLAKHIEYSWRKISHAEFQRSILCRLYYLKILNMVFIRNNTDFNFWSIPVSSSFPWYNCSSSTISLLNVNDLLS